MNAGNVHAFGCGRAHPQLGDQAVCVRQRHHPGDHRTEHEGRLKVWTDEPYGVPLVRELTDHDGDPLPPDALGVWPARGGPVVSDPVPGDLDEHAETWLEARGTGGVWLWVDDVTRLVGLVLLVMLALAGPALLTLLYGAAYG